MFPLSKDFRRSAGVVAQEQKWAHKIWNHLWTDSRKHFLSVLAIPLASAERLCHRTPCFSVTWKHLERDQAVQPVFTQNENTTCKPKKQADISAERQ